MKLSTGLYRLNASILLIFNLFSYSTSQAGPCQIGLVFDIGGKDDKSFNAAALEGLLQVQKELQCTVKYVEPTDHNSFESLLRAFAQKNFDLIISVGVAQVDAVRKVANQFKARNFVILDGEVQLPNVRSYLFEEQEGSFLVGAIAALKSKTGHIGFIGGMDIPLIRRFEKGFEAGAKLMDPKVRVTTNFIGNTSDSWNNPAKAKELALMQYAMGVDIVFGVAGASGFGLFDAAEEKNKLAIGVDSNQNSIKPGYVLTSMIKRVDRAVYDVSRDFVGQKFSAGTVHVDLSNQGVGYTLDSYNEKLLPSTIRKKIEQIRADIISKKIQVPDYYKMRQGSL